MLNEIYHNKTKREKMGNESFEIWKEKYSWEVIARQYEQLYSKLVNQ